MAQQMEFNLNEPTGLYEFDQNNSGGNFVYSETLGERVLIEARSPGEANERASDLGIYFDGVRQGADCGCCGDRWYDKWDDAKPDFATIEEAIEQFGPHPDAEYFFMKNPRQFVVHYLDGRVEWHNREWDFHHRP